MSPRQRTLMAVHAHPDDEAIFTGGVLARYADEGVRTVVVTCTGGELGYPPDGGEPAGGSDPEVVAAGRRRELQASCEVLGVSALELLGYGDSGLAGWPQNEAPGAFVTVPVPEAADRLAVLLERHRPDVVVTYDADGFYGHPDHVHAHRVAVEAIARTGIPRKTYFVAMPRSHITTAVELAVAAGMTLPDWLGERTFGIDDERVTTTIDCRSVVGRKYRALAAHANQHDNDVFLDLGEDVFAFAFGTEWYVRGSDRTGAAIPEDDLFAGIG